MLTGVLNVAAHGAAFLHLKRAGGQLVGTHNLGGIEGDAGLRFHQHDRHGRSDGIRCRHVSRFDAADRQRAGLWLIFNHRAIRESHVPRIRRGRRGGVIIGENTRQHESGIELAANGQQQHLLTHRGRPPRARTTGAGGQPVQPCCLNAAALYAAKSFLQIEFNNYANPDKIPQHSKDFL